MNLYTEAFIRYDKFLCDDMGTRNHATMQLCNGCNQGRHTTCFHIPPREWLIEGDKCWCTHKTLMYAFDWHELMYGDVIRYDNVQCDDMGTRPHTQLCYSAMYAQKDGISHVLFHRTGIHRGDKNGKNTRCSFYPTTGQDEVLCWVHSKMRVCPTCWIDITEM